MNKENENNLKYWDNFYKKKDYKMDDIVYDDWLDKYGKIIDEGKLIIDLGCGSGNNIKYLMDRGKNVFACDGSKKAIEHAEKNFPNINGSSCFDMTKKFPLGNSISNLVIADLSLHYFTREDTIKIMKEIRRILINKGNLLARVNSTNDTNYKDKDSLEIEPNLYRTKDGRLKRFFSYEDIFTYFNIFDILNIYENETDRYGMLKKTYEINVRNRK